MAGPAEDAARWLSAARTGSPEALGQLLEACRGYLLLVAGRELDPALQAKGGASDLVQETFMEAQRDFARFQGHTEADLLAWLRQLLLHNLTDFTRLYRATDKRQIRREVVRDAGDSSSDAVAGQAATTPSPSSQAIEHEQAETIRLALERLPADYRRVIQLRYEEDRSFEEIGQMLSCTPNAARKLWVRAIKRLQQESGGPSP